MALAGDCGAPVRVTGRTRHVGGLLRIGTMATLRLSRPMPTCYRLMVPLVAAHAGSREGRTLRSIQRLHGLPVGPGDWSRWRWPGQFYRPASLTAGWTVARGNPHGWPRFRGAVTERQSDGSYRQVAVGVVAWEYEDLATADAGWLAMEVAHGR